MSRFICKIFLKLINSIRLAYFNNYKKESIMGATSVTGTGAGAGEPNKGPLNNRTQYVSILDPHVVYSGTVYIEEGGNVDVELPEYVWDVPEKLTIVTAGKAYGTDKNVNVDGVVTSFTIAGSKKRDIDFLVIKDINGKFVDGDYD
jgi:hypothetical protein